MECEGVFEYSQSSHHLILSRRFQGFPATGISAALLDRCAWRGNAQIITRGDLRAHTKDRPGEPRGLYRLFQSLAVA
jgi:hypothetical protein